MSKNSLELKAIIRNTALGSTIAKDLFHTFGKINWKCIDIQSNLEINSEIFHF